MIPQPAWRRLGIGLAAEAVLWLVPASAFLALYVRRFDMPRDAVSAHLAVLLLYAVAVVAARAAARALLGPQAARWAGAALMATGFWLLCVYYTLVIGGLTAWARVPTFELVAAYIPQIPQLLRVLEVDARLLLALLAAALLTLFWLMGVWLRRFEWLDTYDALQPARARRLLTCGLAAAWGAAVFHWSGAGLLQQSEPFSTTVFGDDWQYNRMQSHVIAADPEAVKAEQTLRQTYAASPQAQRRNVILVVADALRADHMGVYGYGRDTTPHLAALDRAGRLRRAAVARAVCSESACGLLGLTSGRYVHQFVDRPFTLHDVLRRHGYRISLILGGDHVNFYGLRRLYGQVDDYVDGSMFGGYFNDDREILRHVERLPGWNGQPRLLHFHFMSAHSLANRMPEFEVFRPFGNYGGRVEIDGAEQRALAVNFYDNGVRQFDALLRELLGTLERKGYLDDALVIVVGDHGEYLGEFGRLMHARGVHEPVLRIPFLALAYGYRPTEPFAARAATQVDVAPTILHELGMTVPSSWTGIPMQREAPPRLAYFQQAPEFGLIDERGPAQVWKYWRDRSSGEYAFNLAEDPRETRNQVGAVNAEWRALWRRETDSMMARGRAAR